MGSKIQSPDAHNNNKIQQKRYDTAAKARFKI